MKIIQNLFSTWTCFIFLLAIPLFFVSCDDDDDDIDDIVLTVTGSDKHNLVGQTVIKGVVSNKATVAVYKDVDLQLDFYSKTGALLETDRETVYETIRPGQSKSFKTKYFAPKGSDSVGLKVLSAKIVE